MKQFFVLLLTALVLSAAQMASAGVEGSLSGTVLDSDEASVAGASVKLLSPDGRTLKETKTSPTGAFDFFPVDFGSYQVVIEAPDHQTFKTTTTVTSGGPARIDAHLASGSKEYVVNVKEKRNLVQVGASGSKTDFNKDQIATLPGGDNISLPKLLATTTPGIVQGPFGQTFIRGSHANVQYQIDGVQLPDSPSGSFGEAFSPRNIDHMEVITGGIPAEYGERMAAVVNIITKAGPETPGGSIGVRYGSNDLVSPQLTYGGSDSSGRFRYFTNFNYMQTNRGLETPNPVSETNQKQGGKDAVHDQAHGDDEFVRLDYQMNDANKFSLNLFNSYRFYQIPNYPSSFKSSDAFFQPGFKDQFGNQNDDPTLPTYNWTPADTNDSQAERNTYAEFVWKHSFSERSFLQVAPYYKKSQILVNNDPGNDLASLSAPNLVPNSQATSFGLNHDVNNYGLKTDYSLRLSERQLIKAGFQAQQSVGSGSFSLQTKVAPSDLTSYQLKDNGSLEAVYLQDSYTLFKPLVLNAGLRYSAIQFKSDDLNTQDGLLQPRVGLEYMAAPTTKLHVFYGKLFQPAPFENLREAFTTQGGGNSAAPYDIKSEKDDYYETGIAQQIGAQNLLSLNVYYKNATNMLDDAQLLNTSIAQPYNFATGYAKGIELSYTGDIAPHWSQFANYSYEEAKGRGMSGGFFAVTAPADNTYQYLDHCQIHTLNAGLTYKADAYFGTVTGLYGSGLRTGPDNSESLPSHITFDLTAGYNFSGEAFWSKWRVSGDIINLFDNAYPITVYNGFNGSHYDAGREFFVRVTKDL